MILQAKFHVVSSLLSVLKIAMLIDPTGGELRDDPVTPAIKN